MPRRANDALMTLKWSCSGCLRPLLFPMKDNLPRSGRGIASDKVVPPEPVSPRTRARPAGISSSACSMHRRPVTASSVITMGPHPPDPDLRSPRPRRPAGPLERRPGPVRKAAARGSIRPICSTWNPSSDLPKPPGRAPSTLGRPRCLGKNSTTEDLLACPKCAGFATAPHADAPPSEAPCLAATGAQASSQGAVAADRSSSSAQGNAAGASPDDASANFASGSSVNAVLMKPVDPTRSQPSDPVSARTTQTARTEGGTSMPKGGLIGHVSEARGRGRSNGFIDRDRLRQGGDPRRARDSTPQCRNPGGGCRGGVHLGQRPRRPGDDGRGRR